MRLKVEPLENFSGIVRKEVNAVPTLKRRDYEVVEGFFITGDAPKEYIRVYEYLNCRRSNKKNWPLYIAKTGHKWYPTESITEYLISRIGETLNLNMSDSPLVAARGQIRYLSRYFIRKTLEEELVHGADIYAGYLEDKDFTEEVERKGQARALFSLQFTDDAVAHLFPVEHNSIMTALVKMLLFDALLGQNDRHFYNWGVVRNIFNKSPAKFSPIYDSARALFWNDPEKKIETVVQGKRVYQYIEKYSSNSKPKIGLDGQDDLNHMDMVRF